MSNSMRIYGFEITDHPHEEEPAGWAEHCEEVWGEHRDFFLPSEKKVFRSRSAAQARVDLVKRWGGDAVLLEGTVQWETVEAANRRRKRSRSQSRINALEAQIDALREEGVR